MDLAYLKKVVRYDPETGVFTRIVSAGNRRHGSAVGSLNQKGYLEGSVCGHLVKLHRLAWFYTYGSWPKDQIDHINGVKDDNRIANLRDCDTSTNCLNQVGARRNNALGLQGVHKIPKTGRFRVSCTVNGVRHNLGVYADQNIAASAYATFKTKHLPAQND